MNRKQSRARAANAVKNIVEAHGFHVRREPQARTGTVYLTVWLEEPRPLEDEQFADGTVRISGHRNDEYNWSDLPEQSIEGSIMIRDGRAVYVELDLVLPDPKSSKACLERMIGLADLRVDYV